MPVVTTIYGTESADTIYGGPGDENLVGLGGNDFLSGQGGDDAVVGGDGDDVLVGDYGNDQLHGQAGNDAMFGGYGNDFYFVTDVGDTITEIAGAGNDFVASTIDWTLGANLENLIMVQPASTSPTIGAIRGTGNALANTIDGNNLNNILNGLGGNDILNGFQGNDRLNGGAGNDRMDGGLGNDVLYGGAGSDIMNGNFGNDTYLFTQADANLSATDRVRIVGAENDRIDLRQIDAIAGDGNQAFTFIGGNAFSGTAGELRFVQSGTWMDFSSPFQPAGLLYEVAGDIDGDGLADFRIIVEFQNGNSNIIGQTTLDASDFWL